jgi:hypothetical protein
MMVMYFSANPYLKNIVAPTMDTMPVFSAREFGALEMLQNFLLLCIVYYAIAGFFAARNIWVRLVTFCLVSFTVFVFLEEIDYGTPFVEYMTGAHGSLAPDTWDRNWHNKMDPAGTENVSYLKSASHAIMLVGFVLAPLLLARVRHPTVRLLLPSRWMIATVVVIVLLSLLAHYLDDAGFARVADNPGNLHKNISEFNELNMYYLFLLYIVLLYERLTGLQSGAG